ncbi:MAG: universal stress protein [Nitrospirae bacterium]|nr:universal stress protein [Nitrospirota bacterium]
MYKRILCAVNEFLNSEVAARYALHLARECNAKLYLCFIAGKKLSDEDFNRAEEALKRLFRQAEGLGIETEEITETGDPVGKIAEIVKNENIDIVFAATRREDVKRKFYEGTISRKLSLSLPCSVAIVRVVHIGKMHPKRILVPLLAGAGKIEEKAFFTAKLAAAFGSKIFVFHAPKSIKKFFHGEIHLTRTELEKQIPGDILLFTEKMERNKVPHEISVAAGKTGRAITIEAFTKRHDLIIMGASRRGLLKTAIKGSPVEEVLRETPCDLIIFKPGI